MAEEREAQDLGQELQLQRYRIDDLTGELDSLRIRVTALPAALALAICLFLPMYLPVNEDGTSLADSAETISLSSLPGEASDIENGLVNVTSIVLIVALAAGCILALALALAPNRRVALAAPALGAVTLVVWLVLALQVGSSGGGGTIDELGYENTVRILLIPAAVALSFAAAQAVRSAAD